MIIRLNKRLEYHQDRVWTHTCAYIRQKLNAASVRPIVEYVLHDINIPLWQRRKKIASKKI
jgi:hypothetical protein